MALYLCTYLTPCSRETERFEALNLEDALLKARGVTGSPRFLAVYEANDLETNLMEMFIENGYYNIRRLPDGTWAFLQKLAFTTAICLGADDIQPFIHRYCYDSPGLALAELDKLQELDDEPTGWIARRPERG